MRVLAVDDDPTARLIVQRIVISLGHECLLAVDPAQAWTLLTAGGIDVVITDREMPGGDGLQLCRWIRAELAESYIYLVVATSLDAPDQEMEGMRAGADHYLTKRFGRHQMRLRLTAAERVTAVHRRGETRQRELQDLARRDHLTGLGNRLRRQDDLEVLRGRVARYGHRYSLALLDLDHFKAYNDRYGHQAGDRVALHRVGAGPRRNRPRR